MDTLHVAILKDDTPTAELIVVAAKPEQLDRDLTSTNDMQSHKKMVVLITWLDVV